MKVMRKNSGGILTCTVDKNLEPVVCWLEQEIGFDKSQVRKVLVALLSILSYSIEMSLKPAVEWLKVYLGFDQAQVRKALVATPQILG